MRCLMYSSCLRVLHLLHRWLQNRLVTQLTAEQLAGLIDDGDRLRLHAGNATRHQLAIASTCPASRLRPGCRSSTTEAVGFSSSRPTNRVRLGIARWTRALRTASSAMIERAYFAFQRMAVTCGLHELAGPQTRHAVQALETGRQGRAHARLARIRTWANCPSGTSA